MTLTAPAEAVCVHISDTIMVPEGTVSTCRLCGQRILVPWFDGKNAITETALARGYIKGVMTAIHPPPSLKEETKVYVKKADRVDPRWKKTLARYAPDKEKIIADYKNLTMQALFKKWHFCIGTWQKLKKLWEVPDKGRGGDRRKKPGVVAPPAGTESDRHVTVHVYQLADGFPPFKDCCDGSAQCEWLRVYRDLSLASPGKIAVPA